MENVFCITYGWNTYVPYKAIAHTAEEAIAVINTWKTYGRKTADCIVVNATTEEKIRELFRDGLGTGFEGKPRTWVDMRTTGCGAWPITFEQALADTLEEHNRIEQERKAVEAEEWKKRHKLYVQKRLAELNERKRGWYHASLEIRLYVAPFRGNDYFRDAVYTCEIIADSGMDAYNKTVECIREHPEELVVNGNYATFQSCCEPSDRGFEFTFLGVKTDDGFSVEEWEEWHRNGEI